MATSGGAQGSRTINVNKWIDESKFNAFHTGLLLLCMFLIMFDGYDLFVYGAAVPTLLKLFNMSPARAGVIGSYALIGAAVGALVLGPLADKIGRKKTILVCAAIFSLATFVTGTTSTATTFGLCRFIAGLGIGGSLPNVVALASEYAPQRNRALTVATIMSGMVLGGIVAAGLSIWLFPLFGWRSVFYAGAIPLLFLPLHMKYLPEAPVQLIKTNKLKELRSILARVRPQEALPADAIFEINRGGGKSPIVDLFREKRGVSTVLIWILYFMSMYMIYGLGVWLPKMMMNAGFPLSSGLWLMLVLNLGAFIASQIAGLAADRLGPKYTIVVCFLLTFASIALLSQTRNFYLLLILVALAGAGNNAGQNIAHSYASLYYPPTMRSTGMGFAFGLGRFGAIFGPAITGLLMSMHMSLYGSFMSLAVPGLVAAAVMMLIQDKYSFSRR
jgi:AAHS family benzoate transporter-like MFS transporter